MILSCNMLEVMKKVIDTCVCSLQFSSGVGAYTSAAVASIAFGDPSAVVDGNVVRVISRLRSLGGDPTTQGAVHAVMAQQLLDKDRPGDFNQVCVCEFACVARGVNGSLDTQSLSSYCGIVVANIIHSNWLNTSTGNEINIMVLRS